MTEARLAAAIEHPNVCRVYDFLSTDEHDLIVMEYVGGETLFKAKRRGLKLEEALRVLWQGARWLAAAHERGVVQRDLESDNVMLTPFGVAKITDFGISKRENDAPASESRLTGTPHSMSPEQSLGQATDARSDLFSFGVLCHELIGGESPFVGRDLHETLHRVRVLTIQQALYGYAAEPVVTMYARADERRFAARVIDCGGCFPEADARHRRVRRRQPSCSVGSSSAS